MEGTPRVTWTLAKSFLGFDFKMVRQGELSSSFLVAEETHVGWDIYFFPSHPLTSPCGPKANGSSTPGAQRQRHPPQ